MSTLPSPGFLRHDGGHWLATSSNGEDWLAERELVAKQTIVILPRFWPRNQLSIQWLVAGRGGAPRCAPPLALASRTRPPRTPAGSQSGPGGHCQEAAHRCLAHPDGRRRGPACGAGPGRLLVLQPGLQGRRRPPARWSQRQELHAGAARPAGPRRRTGRHPMGHEAGQAAAVTVGSAGWLSRSADSAGW